MAQETYSPAQAAKQAGVPLSTLRLWCGIYAEFLSGAANPGAGVSRRLTAQDIEVMKAVAQLRHNGIEQAQIIERLRTTPLETLQPPAAPAIAPTTGATLPTIATGHDPSIQAFLERAQLADDLKSIDRRLERVEHNRNLVIVAAAGFVAGVVLVVGIVWILSLLR